MPLNPGNLGPPDDSPWSEPTVITFPSLSPYPGVHRFGFGTEDRQEVYVTNPLLSNSGMYPLSLDRRHTVKVWAPSGLEPMDNLPGHDTVWNSFEQYRSHLKAVNGNNKTAGIFINTERGRCVDYRIAITGKIRKLTVPIPDAIVDLMRLNGCSTFPTHLNGMINPNNIRFQTSRNFTDWMNLEQLGLNAVKTQIPNPVLERIHARFAMKSPTNKNFQLHLTAEFVVTPRDLAPNGLTDNLKDVMDSSGLRTLEIWTDRETYTWDETFPILTGKFNNRTPVPVCREKYPETDIKPSQWTLHRICYDIFLRSRAGAKHESLQASMNWFYNSDRTYVHDLSPVLIIPQVPQPPPGYEYPTRELPGDINGPYDGSQLRTRPNHPAYQMQFPRFDQDRPGRNNPEAGQSSHQAADDTTPPADPGKSPSYIIMNARGKYQSNRDCSGLIERFTELVPDIPESEAALLAKIMQASIADRTAKTQASIKNSIQKLFPNRPDMFRSNKPGDEIKIIAKMKAAQYKNRTIISYVSNYERIVLNSGGTVHPRLPETKHLMKGLANLDHNPAEDISKPARKAYSLESLQLVGIKGVHNMKTSNKWDEYRSSLFRAVIFTLFFGRLRTAEALGTTNKECNLLTNLLASDVVFDTNKTTGECDSVRLHLRSAKYKEKTGAIVVIPALNRPYCPVKALIKYMKFRETITNDQQLPLFLTNKLWSKGDSKPENKPGIYTQSRFSRDTKAAIKLLVQQHPALSEVTEHLHNHSLRAGIPTALQLYDNIPEEIR